MAIKKKQSDSNAVSGNPPEITGTLDTGTSTSSLPPPPPGSDQSPGTGPEETPVFEPGPSGRTQVIGTRKVELPCILTPDEQHDRSMKLAQSFGKITIEMLRQKRIKDDLKAIMSKLGNEQTDLAIAVETGEEKRLVEVDIVMLGDGETVSEVRRDTMAAINTRPATDFERQGKLFSDVPIFPDE
ncbi:MAG: hypothetical protein PHU23_00255 [Dehalococcoidales bacterium]|nr:hypothetical protein [Dehalococcoidales bacterium]